MALVTRPSTALPVSGDDMNAEQITDWINALLTFLEAHNINAANVDLTGTDFIVDRQTTQTISGAKTFSDATITILRSLGYLTTMQGLSFRVTAGEAITANDLVYISAWDSTNSRFTVKKAIATSTLSTTFYAQFVSPNAITNGEAGTVYEMYVLTTQNTNGLTAGRPVFLSTSGGSWTGTLPTSPNLVQIVGYVVTVDATTGRVAIKLPGQNIPWSIADQV